MIFDRLATPRLREDVTWTTVDPRWYQAVNEFSETFAGYPIDGSSAKRVSAVFAAVSLIAETVASLPCLLFQRNDNGEKRRAREHPAYRTLRYRPNSWMSTFDFMSGTTMNLCLRGNGLARLQEPTPTRLELIPMRPEWTLIEQLTNHRIRYTERDPKGGEPHISFNDMTLHIRDLSEDGFTGLARASLAREAIAVAAAGEAFVGGFFKHDATGRLVMKHPGSLNDKQRAELEDRIRRVYAGWRNKSRTMLLTHGVEVQELGRNGDSDFIVDPRKFQVSDVARYWRVPSFLIGMEDKTTAWGTGVAEFKQAFVDFTLKPWTDRWARALELALLTPEEIDRGYFVGFVFEELVKGNLLDRYNAYKTGREMGVLSPNEIRQKEDMGPREGGDAYMETTPGAAPNAGGGAAASAPPPPRRGATPQASAIPRPLLADAVRRIAAAEARNVIDRHPDVGSRAAELHRAEDFVARTLAPFAETVDLPGYEFHQLVQAVTRTAERELAETSPMAWLERRPTILLALLDDHLGRSVSCPN